ncbi:MAG: hypothetical protein J6V33_02120, partial [Bacteroidales bacterium]|nr:hypothetical protein [Bacteroidales bacterium]
MRVLQICNDFAGSKVHSNLIKENDILGIHQTIYCPVRDSKLLDGNKFESKNTEFIYSYIIKSWYKFFYHYKRRIIFNDLKNKIDLPKNDLIHAATLFSDGAIAYMIYKKYHIPYVVAIRNTDVNLFGKKLLHTWSLAQNILLNAEKIYFISNALKQSFETLSFVKPILKQIENKFIFRPNGVEKVWLDNIQTSKCSEANKILYVGDFSANKNLK